MFEKFVCFFKFKLILLNEFSLVPILGTAYELQGHSSRISSVCLARQPQLLLSGGEDHMVLGWSMKAKRQETPEWKESDVCERCQTPFFW